MNTRFEMTGIIHERPTSIQGDKQDGSKWTKVTVLINFPNESMTGEIYDRIIPFQTFSDKIIEHLRAFNPAPGQKVRVKGYLSGNQGKNGQWFPSINISQIEDASQAQEPEPETGELKEDLLPKTVPF